MAYYHLGNYNIKESYLSRIFWLLERIVETFNILGVYLANNILGVDIIIFAIMLARRPVGVGELAWGNVDFFTNSVKIGLQVFKFAYKGESLDPLRTRANKGIGAVIILGMKFFKIQILNHPLKRKHRRRFLMIHPSPRPLGNMRIK